jgi:hypothetical protein
MLIKYDILVLGYRWFILSYRTLREEERDVYKNHAVSRPKNTEYSSLQVHGLFVKMTSIMKNSKIIIFVVAILVLAGTGVILVKKSKVSAPTPNVIPTVQIPPPTKPTDLTPIIPVARVSTEGWKTCRNEKYGYEFKYPAEWYLYDSHALSKDGSLEGVSPVTQCSGQNMGAFSYKASEKTRPMGEGPGEEYGESIIVLSDIGSGSTASKQEQLQWFGDAHKDQKGIVLGDHFAYASAGSVYVTNKEKIYQLILSSGISSTPPTASATVETILNTFIFFK